MCSTEEVCGPADALAHFRTNMGATLNINEQKRKSGLEDARGRVRQGSEPVFANLLLSRVGLI